MENKFFISIPSKDLKATTTFFARMGFSFDPQFSDDNSKCLIISDATFVMIITEELFKTFTGKDIPGPSGVILSFTRESRESVDEFMESCITAGGIDVSKPQTMDAMYVRSFEDPDGHLWEVFHMDVASMRMEPDVTPAQSR